MHLKSSTFLILTLLVGLLGFQCSQVDSVEEETQKPNVILIYADDLGYGDLTCYNPQSKIQTPNIDQLAAAGMKFTDGHSAASFCTPSRYSILTGKYCWRTQPTSELQGGYGEPIIQDEEMTLGHLFQQSGYKTAAIGKWHVGMHWSLKNEEDEQEEEHIEFESALTYTPIDQGFDYYFGTSGCTSDDSPFAFIENRKLIGLPLTPVTNLNVVGDGDYLKDVLVAQGWQHEKADTIFTNKAIDFMETQVEQDQPFFVYLPLSLPHIPWLPADFVKGTTGAGPRGDLVALTDYCVGEVLQALERLGVEENTIVIFTSDNGPREGVKGHRSAGNLRGYKGSIYEGGHRVPFIVKWPGQVPSNQVSDQLIGQVDIYATLASILGHALSENEAPDSFDYAGILAGSGGEESVREDYIHLFYAVRQGAWKLIFELESITDVSMHTVVAQELYNLEEDPAESENLIEDYPELIEELKARFIEIHGQSHSRPVL